MCINQNGKSNFVYYLLEVTQKRLRSFHKITLNYSGPSLNTTIYGYSNTSCGLLTRAFRYHASGSSFPQSWRQRDNVSNQELRKITSYKI